MTTPICDFVNNYVNQNPLRVHMPGHKGQGPLGFEARDVTEIDGADVLYHAGGIIRESEENAAALFGSYATFYSAEGSSLCVRAMLDLALLHAREQGKTPRIAAGRNAHKSFLSALALLDVDAEWLWPSQADGLLSCTVTAEALEVLFTSPTPPTAVYITSPDYLGNRADLTVLSEVCHHHGALLLVDNAHGAYLHFLPEACHPLDQGADLCCDSAHKTLPVLTGGAYLHVGRGPAAAYLASQAESALALFASTSPSYLILQSLDAANPYLAEGYRERLAAFLLRAAQWRERVAARGWPLLGDEPLKLTLSPKPRGYTGTELAERLAGQGVHVEFADPDYLVMMLSPEMTDADLERVEAALAALPRRAPILAAPPPLPRPRRVLSPREALLAPRERVPLERAGGRVLADPAVSCPPAVPILVCGEEISAEALACLRYYGTNHCLVVK